MHKRGRGAKYISVKKYVNEEWLWDRVTVRTIDNRPMWHLFKEYVNSLKPGDFFSRKDLFRAIYFPQEAADAMRGHESTIDHYRLYCTHLGYIDRVSTGWYVKRFDIPVNATTKLVEIFAYNAHQWREWFIPKCERRKALELRCQ